MFIIRKKKKKNKAKQEKQNRKENKNIETSTFFKEVKFERTEGGGDNEELDDKVYRTKSKKSERTEEKENKEEKLEKEELNESIPNKNNPRFMTEEEIKELENKHPELAKENQNKQPDYKNNNPSSHSPAFPAPHKVEPAKNQRKKILYKRENFNRPKKSIMLDENLEKNSEKEQERDDDSKKVWKKKSG